MPDMTDLIGVTDARVWAREWLKLMEFRPELARDEGAMVGWFANALQVGVDDFAARHPLAMRLERVRDELREGIELPEDWTPEQWTSTLMVKLGQACLTFMGPGGGGCESRGEVRVACEQLMGLAAGALDAVEALRG